MKTYGRLFPIFSAVFVMVFALCVYFNWALFTYFPAKHQLAWFVPGEASQPGAYPMFWYGWLSTTTIVSVLVAAVMSILPVGRQKSIPPLFVGAGTLLSLAIITVALAHWFTMR